MLFTCPFFALFKWLLLIPFLLLSVTVKGGASQACAACKYQRRRCTPDCPLAPFFPADQPKIFQNAHRLYGVANMMRILKHVRDDQKDDVMQSIKYESNMWERFPFYGCCDVLRQLYGQVRAHQAELSYVRGLIEMVHKESYGVAANYDVVVPQCDEGTSYEAEMKPLWAQQQLQAEMASQQYDGLISEALVADDRQSYTEGKEEYDLSRCSSGSSSLNVAMQSTSVKVSSQNELKTAPMWFSHLSLAPSDDQDH